MLSLVTIAAEPGHRCFIPGVDTNISTAVWNTTAENILSAIPRTKDDLLDQCKMFSGNETVGCDEYVYDR